MTVQTINIKEESSLKLTDKLIGFSIFFVFFLLSVIALSNIFSYVSTGASELTTFFNKELQVMQKDIDTLNQNQFCVKER